MRITERIARRTKPLVSLEITPPEKGHSIQELYDTIDQLLPFDRAFVAVTWHQPRIVGEDIDGRLLKKVYSTRAIIIPDTP